MPKAIKKRIKKKEAATEADVKDRLSEIKDSLQEKQKAVLTYSIIAVIVVLAVSAVLFYWYSSHKKSLELEYQAYKLYYNEYQTAPQARQEQFQQSLDLFKQAYSKRKSPRLLFYIASSYYELNRYDDTINSLDELIKKYSDEEDLIPLAYQKLSMTYLKKASKDEALKTLDTLYALPGHVYKDYALIESGRILEKDGKKEEAKAKYKELTEKFPSSPFAEEARNKLGVVKEPEENPEEKPEEES